MTHWNDADDLEGPEPPKAPSESGDEVDESEPDVLLDVPDLSVDEIDLEVEDLRANVSLQADVLDLLKLHVGADVKLGRVSLTITGVQAQAQLKVRLNRVAEIIGRVLTTIDRNPEVLEHVVRTVEPVLRDAGVAVGELGEGGRRALEDVGHGAGDTVEGVGGATEELTGDPGTAMDSLTEKPEAAGAEAETGMETGMETDMERGPKRRRPPGDRREPRRRVPPKRRRPRPS
ncbi:hypothetical protein [Saccharomonospora cyanea]|uniref:Uncharacterized protein n=1 Tax=Saccharomonospora cyanea NA-134 TaxID=882082 RepID=H5XFK1_9PSEU|nr:hypothetical protein [Saccharomonospora cyanea]EHR59369.1 hypothetical protein SaccyDRAFT_0438 [Saccharomonospora cyanea NA-134]